MHFPEPKPSSQRYLGPSLKRSPGNQMRPEVSSDPKATFQIKISYLPLVLLRYNFNLSSHIGYEIHFIFLSSQLDTCAIHFYWECWRLSPWDRCYNLDRWPLRSVLQSCAGPADSKWIFLQSPTHLHRQKQLVVQLHLWSRPRWERGTGPVCCLDDQTQCPSECPDGK